MGLYYSVHVTPAELLNTSIHKQHNQPSSSVYSNILYLTGMHNRGPRLSGLLIGFENCFWLCFHQFSPDSRILYAKVLRVLTRMAFAMIPAVLLGCKYLGSRVSWPSGLGMSQFVRRHLELGV